MDKKTYRKIDNPHSNRHASLAPDHKPHSSKASAETQSRSSSNNYLKELSKLKLKKYREEREMTLVEGKRLLDQIHRSGYPIKELFCTRETVNQYQYLQPEKITFCKSWQLEKLSQTTTPQQVIGLLPARRKKITKTDLLLYLDDISEPGNLGTIFRTASGLGVNGIITSPGCCELLNPKALRASMGAVLTCPSCEQNVDWLLQQKSTLIVTALENSLDIRDIKDVPVPSILVIGSEAHGVNKKIMEAADLRIKIPMAYKVESLNAAVAAGITIFYLISHGHPEG
jgi:RNA methyltransferase, TrmH family